VALLEIDVAKLILHIAHMHSTKFGGLERYLLELARQSAERGFGTRILYQAMPTSAEYVQRLRAVGADIVVAELSKGFFSSLRAAHSVIAATRPDVIQTHFLPQRIMRILCALGRAYGARRLVSMEHMGRTLKASMRIKLAYSGFDCVLGVSQAVCANLRTAGVPAERLHVHHMGLIDPPVFSHEARQQIRSSLGIPDAATVFGTIGWESAAKGMDVLLEAFEALLRTRPDVHLIQLGIDREVSALAQRYSHLRQVHWPGILDNAAAYLSALDIYVQPSRSEGLPLSIIEAMATHRPVIATSAGGICEAVVDGITGCIVPPENVPALTAAMLDASNAANSVQLLDLAEAGFQRYVNMFDGRRSVRQLIENYYR
jgi:glycosyltransferase involved in cell wall biosynthesis